MKSHSSRLLISAAIDDRSIALESWRLWLAEFDLDALESGSYWILPMIFRNLASAGHDYPERQRLSGIYKQMRMGNAIIQNRIVDLLGQLAEAACDVLAGAKMYLVLSGTEKSLSLNSSEILIPAGQLEEANRVLESAGWIPLHSLPHELLRPFIVSIRYRHARYRDLVLCWRPFGLGDSPTRDALCWENSQFFSCQDIRLKSPDTVDLAVIAATRGPRAYLPVLRKRLNFSIGDLDARLTELALDSNAAMDPPGTATDEFVPLRELWSRHKQRFRHCPPALRPAGFGRYLYSYYQWAWQSSGPARGPITAFTRRLKAR